MSYECILVEQRGAVTLITINRPQALNALNSQVLEDLVDAFARFFVIPQVNHGLNGNSAAINGDGKPNPSFRIPNMYDRIGVITDWVEQNKAPAKTLIVTSGNRTMPLCSYPNYPRYVTGPPESASSYMSAEPLP